MVCKKCYYNNDKDAKFCAECGEKLEQDFIAENITENVNTKSKDIQNNTVNVSIQNDTQNNNVNENVQKNSQNNNYGTNYNEIINYSPSGAIVSLIFSILCCTNLAGIVFSILALDEGGKIKKARNQGDIQKAKSSFEQYKKWTKFAWISILVWFVCEGLYCGFVIGISILSEIM